jgi:ubiquitin-protein ligase
MYLWFSLHFYISLILLSYFPRFISIPNPIMIKLLSSKNVVKIKTKCFLNIESQSSKIKTILVKKGHTENWTRIIGFKVQCANHYTIRPRYYDMRSWSFEPCRSYTVDKICIDIINARWLMMPNITVESA